MVMMKTKSQIGIINKLHNLCNIRSNCVQDVLSSEMHAQCISPTFM